MLIFNLIGLAVAALGVAIMTAIMSIQRTPMMAGIAFITWGVWMILVDLIYRTKIQKSIEQKKIVHPNAGGHIFFIPVWLWGFAPIALAVVKLAR